MPLLQCERIVFSGPNTNIIWVQIFVQYKYKHYSVILRILRMVIQPVFELDLTSTLLFPGSANQKDLFTMMTGFTNMMRITKCRHTKQYSRRACLFFFSFHYHDFGGCKVDDIVIDIWHDHIFIWLYWINDKSRCTFNSFLPELLLSLTKTPLPIKELAASSLPSDLREGEKI